MKYEAVYLHKPRDGLAARRVIGNWIACCNQVRPHSVLDGRPPCEVLQATPTTEAGRGRDS